MEFNDEKIRALAERIYDLDEEIYNATGSELGRVFTGDRDICITTIMEYLHSDSKEYIIRSDAALVGNMGRSITDRKKRREVMHKYSELMEEVKAVLANNPDRDILDPSIADLNELILDKRFKRDDKLIICIGRTCGAGGNDIGFELADQLRINFYDISVMNEIIEGPNADDTSEEKAGIHIGRRISPVKIAKDFVKYHGLAEPDKIFFDTTKFLLEKAKTEDFVVMGRFADAILTNNHIPHVSIFVTAPLKSRVKRVMELNEGISPKKARIFVEHEDAKHLRTYRFYTGRVWGLASNYDVCINSASFGREGSVDILLRLLNRNRVTPKMVKEIMGDDSELADKA